MATLPIPYNKNNTMVQEPEFFEEELNPMTDLQVTNVLNELETELDTRKKGKDKEKVPKVKSVTKNKTDMMELLINSTITVGEKIQQTNKKLDMLIRIQTFSKPKIDTLSITKEKNSKKITPNNTYIEPPQASKMMNNFCFFQSALFLFLVFANIGIILGCGLGWMEIKVENCIYLCLIVSGLIIFISIFNLLVFICIKKCYYKKNEKYFRI